MIVLFSLSAFGIVGFSIFCYHLMDHFINDTPTIIFDRGGAFGLGRAIAVGVFGGAVFFVGVLERPVTEKIQKITCFWHGNWYCDNAVITHYQLDLC
ncbi:hypothetical protein KDW99_12440 [Marinomonas rhizomae]|uniref:hypothetical protein n=1 Tax=Marinomonas rhizomae TaxID=491948 RepID=UPI002103EC17|nr:hypothetical protein [Marinomonas rhizomae]UTV98084.1 hypothetical protein KDW99_12440 [Marinomonas rhizomae]